MLAACLLAGALPVPVAGGASDSGAPPVPVAGGASDSAVLSARPAATSLRASAVREAWSTETLEAAIATAQPGDTIVLHAAAYGRILLERDFAGAPVRIRAAAGETATVAGFVVSGSGYVLGPLRTSAQTTLLGGAHDVVVDGVGCDLSSFPTDERGVPMSCFVIRDSAHDVRLERTVVRGGWIGVHVYSGGPPSTWVRNVAVADSDLSGCAVDDIHVDGVDTMVVKHNLIHDPQANDRHNDGIQSQASTNLRITRNTFSWTTVAAGRNFGTAIMLGNVPELPERKVTSTYVANNLVARWNGGRALIVNGTERTRVVNNTFVDNGAPGAPEPSITIANQGPAAGQNLGLEIWNNILESVYLDPGSTPPAFFDTNLQLRPLRQMSGTNVVRAAPRFADRVTYRLLAASRARGRGLDRPGTPRVDLDGRKRGRPPSLGARE